MRTTLHYATSNIFGKLNEPRVVNTINNTITSKRLHINDRISGLTFLIDTGSDLSIIPANSQHKINLSNYVIYATNNSQINTFGKRALSIDLSLAVNFHGIFA